MGFFPQKNNLVWKNNQEKGFNYTERTLKVKGGKNMLMLKPISSVFYPVPLNTFEGTRKYRGILKKG